MKPLAIFGGIVVVGLAVIFAGLRLTDHSASADPLPTPLTHAQFVRAGNAVCDRYYRDDPTIFRNPKTVKALTRDMRVAVPFVDREAAGLRALVPPPNDVATYRRLLSGLGQVDDDAHAMLHAFGTGQIRRGVLIARHTARLDLHLNSLANEVGLNICGLTGRQVRARYGKAVGAAVPATTKAGSAPVTHSRSASATTGAANTSTSCRSAAGADACLGLGPGRFFTPAEATRVVRALWAAREHDRAVRATSYSSIETGSAELTDVETIDNARCGCFPYLWTHGQRPLRSATIYLPRQRSYPLYFMASVLAAVPGSRPAVSGTTALLIVTRKSAAEPWHIAVQIWDTAYRRANAKFISPLVDGQNYERPAISPPISATRSWFPMFVAYMNKIKRTGRQPASSEFAPGPLTSRNGLEARPNGFTSGGLRATYSFRSGRFGGPWAFTTTGGTLVCGDVTENVLTKSSGSGRLLLQTRNRRNWGWDLVPGVYSSITAVYEWPICIYPAGTKLGVGGDTSGGYPLQDFGVRVGALP